MEFTYEPQKLRDKPQIGKSQSIGVFTGKGGQGKTTLSLLLAAFYAGQGLKVAVIDLDGRTTTSFAKQRRERNDLQFAVFDLSKLVYALENYDRVIVDSPGNDKSQEVLDTIFSLDLVMIPCEPDLESLRNAIVASNFAYKDRSKYLAEKATTILELFAGDGIDNSAIENLQEAVDSFNKPANWFVIFNNVTDRTKVADFKLQLRRFEVPVIDAAMPTLNKISDYISVGELPHDYSNTSDDAFALVKAVNEVCFDINKYLVEFLERNR